MPTSNDSTEEKIELEHQAAKLFMRHYEQLSGLPIRHIWHNEPKKPDVSCQLNGDRLDLEIAHLYGTEEEAMLILGRDLTESTRTALRELLKVSVDARLLNALNRILHNKAKKTYQSSRVWLVIRNAHPAWSQEQILALQHHIRVPANHPFEQIWMVADMDGLTGIVQLHP
jgi:hypothetical protein